MTWWTGTKLAVFLLLIAAIAAQTARLNSERAAHAVTKAEFATAQAAAERDAAQRGRTLQKAVDTARSSLDEARAEIVKRDAALFRASAVADRLREQLATASRMSTPTCTTCVCPSIGDVAAEGVGLLEEGRELLRACARSNDSCVAERRALIEGWPK